MHANSLEVGAGQDATCPVLFCPFKNLPAGTLCGACWVCARYGAPGESIKSTAGQAQNDSLPAVQNDGWPLTAVRQCAAHSSKLPFAFPYSLRARYWREFWARRREAREARERRLANLVNIKQFPIES